jgi:hypothetical protein
MTVKRTTILALGFLHGMTYKFQGDFEEMVRWDKNESWGVLPVVLSSVW